MSPCLYIPRGPSLGIMGGWASSLRDTIRETSRGCYSAVHGIYTYCLLVFMLSESILFPTVFWVIFHVILSSYYILQESILIPEPCELAYGTTLLLSSAGTSGGGVYAGGGMMGVFYWNTTSSLTYSLLFTLVQLSELSVLGVYTNDSYTGSSYVSLSGLHLLHVLYGILLLGASSGTGYSIDITPIDTIPLDMYPTMDYSY